MAMGGEKRKAEIIDGLASQMGSRLRGDRGRPGDSGSCGPTIRDVAPDDLAERDPLDLYGAALAQLRSAELRQPGEVKLRVYNPKLEQHGWQSTHTVVEIVNDDMPFLVDSVGIELNRHGLNIHLVIHPVLTVRRDEAGRLVDLGTAEQVGDGLRESFMQLEIDRQTRPEVLTQLEADLRRVLGDVRHAVQDWQAMRGPDRGRRWSEVRAGASSVPAEQRAEAEAFLAWIGDGQLHPAGLLQLRARGQRPPGRSCGGSRERRSAFSAPPTTAPCRRASAACRSRSASAPASRCRCSPSPRPTPAARCIAAPISTSSASSGSRRTAAWSASTASSAC